MGRQTGKMGWIGTKWDGMRQNRDGMRQNRDGMRQNRDGMRQNRDEMRQNRDEMRQNRDEMGRVMLTLVTINHKPKGAYILDFCRVFLCVPTSSVQSGYHRSG